MEEQGIMMNRLAVLIQIIFIPIYFTIYSIRWRQQIIVNLSLFLNNSYRVLFFDLSLQWLNLGEGFVFWATVLGLPIFYSLPWIIFSIVRAQRIADAYSLMGRALGRVRLDQKIFYGFNALFALIFFVLPFFSPIITIVGIFLSVRMVTHKIKVGKIHFLFWVIPSIILSFIPALFVGAFYLEYTLLFTDVVNFWNSWVDILFGICLCLAISISYGNFGIFLNEVRIDLGKISEIDFAPILFTKFVVFFVSLIFYFWLDRSGTVIYLLNMSAIILGVMVIFLRIVKRLPSSQGSNFGFLLIPVFTIVQFISTRVAKSVVIGLAAGIFLFLFMVSYMAAGDEEFTLENQ